MRIVSRALHACLTTARHVCIDWCFWAPRSTRNGRVVSVCASLSPAPLSSRRSSTRPRPICVLTSTVRAKKLCRGGAASARAASSRRVPSSPLPALVSRLVCALVEQNSENPTAQIALFRSYLALQPTSRLRAGWSWLRGPRAALLLSRRRFLDRVEKNVMFS